MKIAILGTKGIPNNYGGFEQFAEIVSVKLVERGHDVIVYNPSFHSYKHSSFHGVQIRRIFDPENYIGASANFIYDYLCLKDVLKLDVDIILECGYHSCAPFFSMVKDKRPILITNMDGIEWKRTKWNKLTRLLIKEIEKIAVSKSHYLVSDNIGIQQYYNDSFCKKSFYIAYGADKVDFFDKKLLIEYDLTIEKYFMLIARLEPENNIEIILDGYIASKSKLPFIVIGNHHTKYGNYLKNKYQNYTYIRFIGGVYEKNKLDSLRCFAKAYFHGHSIGGTNPSLLEAMASKAFIIAHNNIFNKAVLKDNAYYFSGIDDIVSIIHEKLTDKNFILSAKEANILTIQNEYSWQHITDLYESYYLPI